jgi:membrane protein CcdC involved in cytochrome C biogenesis
MKTIKDKKIVQPPFLHQDNKVAFVSPAHGLPGETIQDAFFYTIIFNQIQKLI